MRPRYSRILECCQLCMISKMSKQIGQLLSNFFLSEDFIGILEYFKEIKALLNPQPEEDIANLLKVLDQFDFHKLCNTVFTENYKINRARTNMRSVKKEAAH